jgi:hypothetical protein
LSNLTAKKPDKYGTAQVFAPAKELKETTHKSNNNL